MIKNSFSISKRPYWYNCHQYDSFFTSNSEENFTKAMAFTGESISDSKESSIFRQEINGDFFYIKHYHRSRGILSWFGLSRCYLEGRNQLLFNENNIPSAPLVAFGDERVGFKTIRGVIITKAIEDSHSLLEIAEKDPEQFENREWLRTISLELSSITRKMHAINFCHNDLHFRNIIVKDYKKNAKLFLIDCPKGMIMHWQVMARDRKLKDLACLYKKAVRFNIPATVMLRFYFDYAKIGKLTDKDKIIIRKIVNRYSKKS